MNDMIRLFPEGSETCKECGGANNGGETFGYSGVCKDCVRIEAYHLAASIRVLYTNMTEEEAFEEIRREACETMQEQTEACRTKVSHAP